MILLFDKVILYYYWDVIGSF